MTVAAGMGFVARNPHVVFLSFVCESHPFVLIPITIASEDPASIHTHTHLLWYRNGRCVSIRPNPDEDRVGSMTPWWMHDPSDRVMGRSDPKVWSSSKTVLPNLSASWMDRVDVYNGVIGSKGDGEIHPKPC